MSVARFSPSREVLMPMTPRQQLQQQVQGELIPQMAELLLQCVKGTKAIRLADLRSEESRAVFLAEILMLLEPERIAEMKMRVHVADAAFFASREAEHENAARQARADIARYGAGSAAAVTPHYGAIRPGHCWICRERILPSATATLWLTDNLIADVHADCAMRDGRCTAVSQISFLLKGASR